MAIRYAGLWRGIHSMEQEQIEIEAKKKSIISMVREIKDRKLINRILDLVSYLYIHKVS